MWEDSWDDLGLGFRGGLAYEFCFLDGCHGLSYKILFVVDDRDILFCEVTNLVVYNFPKFLRDL